MSVGIYLGVCVYAGRELSMRVCIYLYKHYIPDPQAAVLDSGIVQGHPYAHEAAIALRFGNR